MEFFKKIDTAINTCVDYFDYRIRTGKFIGDIKFYITIGVNFCAAVGKKVYYDTKKSGLFFAIIVLVKTLWQTLMKVKIFAIIAFLIGDTIKLIISYYTDIFIVFAITFPLTILLLNLFQTAIVAFLICLIPILLLNIYCLSGLYYCIQQREAGNKISLLDSLKMLLHRLGTVITPALTVIAIMQEALLSFLILALLLSYTFEFLHLSWEGSFGYWFIIFLAGIILFIGLLMISILLNQTYFTVLFENLSFIQAFKKSRSNVNTYLGYFIFFYSFLYLYSILVIWKMAVSYLYLGITIGLYFTCAFTLLLSFLLWKKFRLSQVQEAEIPQKTPYLFKIIIAFGFINYVLLSFFFVKEYQPFISFVQQQEDNFIASQNMKEYVNTAYNYKLNYPQAWTVYQWSDTSTTFYNNYTGTITGGTWMTITISSYNPTLFNQLFTAEPGPISEIGGNITAKITNMSIQGNDAVNFALTKEEKPYPQYETHFLIHKGTLMYDIAFISISNDVANYDSDLFQKIISSFTFTQ